MKKIVAMCNTDQNCTTEIRYLQEMLPDYEVMYGPEALKKILDENFNPKNIYVIQENNAKIGRKLRKKGAIPFLNYCGESQLYAKVFYSRLKRIAPEFQYRMYFEGMFDNLPNCNKENNLKMHFPCHIDKFAAPEIKWEDRGFVAIAIGNKFVEQKNIFPRGSFKIKKYVEWFFRLFFESKTRKTLRKNELQNKRFELIEYFGSKGVLKLQGPGWRKLNRLPSYWRTRLKDIITEQKPIKIKNKLEFFSKYKFNLAIENLSSKGYVTEKIFDAMLANTIPIYIGAPDITDFVPKECFIDLREFKNNDELYDFMKNMSEAEANNYFTNIQKFMSTEEAKKYTERGFSKIIADLIKSGDVNNDISSI